MQLKLSRCFSLDKVFSINWALANKLIFSAFFPVPALNPEIWSKYYLNFELFSVSNLGTEIWTGFHCGLRLSITTSLLPASMKELSALIFWNFKYGSLLSQKSKKESVFISFAALNLNSKNSFLDYKYLQYLKLAHNERLVCLVIFLCLWHPKCWFGFWLPLRPQLLL